MISSGNLFESVAATSEEYCEDLIAAPAVRIERIVSNGQATPPGEWLSQDHIEFVLLVSGSAAIAIAGEGEPRVLRASDWLRIPPNVQHRVEWTQRDAQTVWLAAHFDGDRATDRLLQIDEKKAR